jgi:undecaprenyl-diphosphatase
MDTLIEILKYLLFGTIQGLLEVLPISSSGHVAFLQEIITLEVDGSILFLSLINLGSVIAIIYFLKKDIKVYLVDSCKYIFKKNREKPIRKNFYYLRNVVIGVIPVAILGLTASGLIEKIYSISPFILIGIGSLLTATILYLVRNITNTYVNQDFTVKDSLMIGLVQLISVLPGLSRMGATTAAGLKRKLSMDSALKFSFMMAIPISFGSILSELWSFDFSTQAFSNGFDPTDVFHYIYYFSGFAASIVVTYFALKFVFVLFRRGDLRFFYIYNFVFGFISLFIGISR